MTTLHVCILGIDGSGKSTVTAALPAVLAGEMTLLAGSSGEAFRITGPEEDLLSADFCPDGLPLSAKLSLRLKPMAKKYADHRKLYPLFKLAQMISQDNATQKLARRYGPAILLSDGNTLVSATGRAANYLRPASDQHETARQAPSAADLKAVYSFLLDGEPVPAESRPRLPDLSRGRWITKITRWLGLRAIWLPDMLIFLDLSPEVAIRRIASRGSKVDRHENEADLAQAREMYLRTMNAFSLYRTPDAARVIVVNEFTPAQTLHAVVDTLRPQILAHRDKEASTKGPLGTTALNKDAIKGKAFRYRYVVRYLMAKFFRGAWREPTFFFSNLGRLFLKEGYSAGVMRVIYDQDEKQYGRLDRVFLEYPLHRAVYDRVHILTRKIEPVLDTWLKEGRALSLFTAPSGFAYDLFRPLEAIAKRSPDAIRRVSLLAADLDPHGYLAEELKGRAEKIGLRFQFLRGDITSEEMRAKFAASAPYDMALFVGLSSWLPKPQTLSHFRWIADHLRTDGVLVTDCFTPAPYALSGKYMGYKAHYYTPEVYKEMLEYCGFRGLQADVESGRDKINHVVVAKPYGA